MHLDDRKEEKKKRKSYQQKDRSKYKKSDFEKWESGQRKEASLRSLKKNLASGKVLSISAQEILVYHEKEIVSCTLKGSLKKERSRKKNLLVVGDEVLFELETGLISLIQERSSTLSKCRHLDQKEQLIASNIDLVLITCSVSLPPLSPPLIDRYIIASLRGGMTPVIVVNKIDLGKNEELLSLMQLYRELGVEAFFVSTRTEEGIEKLKERMAGRSSVFVGESGVGKTSLLNLVSQLQLPIGEVGSKSGRGKHTTTQARLIPLPCGGWCIDTPGIQRFGLWELRREDLISYFEEIAREGQKCRFPNCSHTHEPDCRVRIAVQENTLSSIRFDSYLKLLSECE